MFIRRRSDSRRREGSFRTRRCRKTDGVTKAIKGKSRLWGGDEGRAELAPPRLAATALGELAGDQRTESLLERTISGSAWKWRPCEGM